MANKASMQALALPMEITGSFQNIIRMILDSVKKMTGKIKGVFNPYEVKILVNNWTIEYNLSKEDVWRIFEMGNGQFSELRDVQDLNISRDSRTMEIKNKIIQEWGISVKEVQSYKDILEPKNFAKAMKCKEFYIALENPELSLDFAKACYNYRNHTEDSSLKENTSKAVRVKVEKAQDYAIKVGYEIQQIRTEFKKKNAKLTFEQIAQILTEKQIPTPRKDSNWIPSTAFRIEKTFLELHAESPQLIHEKLHHSCNQVQNTSPY